MTGSAEQKPGAGSAGDKRAKGNGSANGKPPKREVKILMLHGYTQSGPLFRAKTRALEKLVAKTLAPLNLVPVVTYPTAPNRLSPKDIPGWESSNEGGDEEVVTDSWAWYRKDDASGSYRLLAEGMKTIAGAIEEAVRGEGSEDGGGTAAAAEDEGQPFAPVDGILGFSQGGSMAAMVAAAMECFPTSGEQRPTTSDVSPDHMSWVTALRTANRGIPLKFAVIYSGFAATPPELGWLYEPKITTPTLHFIGSLDTVVEESRTQGLADKCEDAAVMVHPGGHYVPISKEWAMPLVGFIKKCMESEKA